MPALKPKKKKVINLLPVDPFMASLFGRTLQWLLSTFRVIVIVVELVVMSAFLSRFWLDAKNSDLSDEIKQKQALLQSSLKFEEEYKSIQEKISIYSSIINVNTPLLSSIQLLPSMIPDEIKLDNLLFSDNSINFSGSAASEVSIAQLTTNLMNKKEFADVSLTQVSVSEETGEYLFKMIVKIAVDKAQEGKK